MARILVVDDEIGIRELLSEILYDEGHTVELAENAAQARASRLRARPDLVLLDIWMPDTDGVSLLKEWGSQGLLDMPVIMMSGHATVDTAVEATRIGAVDFLEKPITLQKLLKTIAAGLARPVVTPGMAAMARLPEKRAEFGRPHIAAPVSEPIEGVNEASNSLLGSIPLDQPLRNARDEFERIYFEYHLGRENHSMTRVSEKTGLERTHLYRKLKQLGIDSSRKKNN
ncbi:MAG: response regulator [Paralcaligenes sp.]